MPLALRGPKSVRTLLSAAVAGVIGLAPAVLVASPAHALVDPRFAITTSSTPIVETATSTTVNNVTTVTQKKATIYVNLSGAAAPEDGLQIPVVIGTDADTAKGAAANTTGTAHDFTTLADGAVVDIPAGEYSGSIEVTLYDDRLDEDPTQFFTVRVPTDYVTIAPVSAAARATRVYIADDEATPTVSIGDAGNVTEGTADEDDAANDLIFPLTLSNRSEKEVTVEVTTANGATTGDTYGATAPADYTALSKSLARIPPNSPTGIAVVDVNPDATIEASPETLTATLSNPTNATLGTPSVGTGGITDDETAPNVLLGFNTLTADDTVPVTEFSPEGNSGEVTRNINVRLTGATSTIPVRLNYEFVAGNTAQTATNGKDYRATSGSVTIAPGSRTATIPMVILGDTVVEPDDESFGIVLTSPNGSVAAGNLGAANARYFTIDDDDAGPVTYSVGNMEVPEGASGTTTVRFPVKTTGVLDMDVALDVAITPVSADPDGVNEGDTAGANDYDPPTATTVTIPAGESIGYVDLVVNGDTVFERAETLTIDVDAAGADPARISNTPAPGTSHLAMLTIANDDAAPTFKFNEVAAPESGLARIGGTITGIAQDPYTIAFTTAASATATADETGAAAIAVPATPGSDYEVPVIADFPVARGKSGAVTATVGGVERSLANLTSVYMLPDDLDEPTETFTITAAEKGTNLVGFAGGTGTYRITDDPSDLPPAVSVRDESIGEWEQSVDVHVDVIPNGEATRTTQTLTIPYWTVNGTATAGEDFVRAEGVLEISPGETNPRVNIKIINDKWAESDETFEVRFGTPGPSGASVVDGTGVVTIKSDDKTNPVTPTFTTTGPAKGVGAARFTGTVAPNSSVELWGAPLPEADVADFKWLAEVKSDAQGNFEFPNRSLAQGWNFVVRSQELNSPVRTVRVTQNPSFTVSSPSKGKLSVSVAGNPKAAGQAVTVQRLTGGKWVNVGKGTTTATGWKGTFSFKSKTKLTLRASVAGNASTGINTGWSGNKTVTVK